MIHNIDFVKRLTLVMEYYQLSASAFADKINVQRSSISHLLSGRNKPSLDFVLKVLDACEEVELYWLLNGKGTFPKADAISLKVTGLASTLTKEASNKEIDRIIIFYKDGTFQPYNPG